jgi:hypothetical protein
MSSKINQFFLESTFVTDFLCCISGFLCCISGEPYFDFDFPVKNASSNALYK